MTTTATLERIAESRARVPALAHVPDNALADQLLTLVQDRLPVFLEQWDLLDEAIYRLRRGVRIASSTSPEPKKKEVAA